MLFKNITILDENLEVKENCYVGIKDGLIDYIDNNAPEQSYGEVYDGRGKLLMSGFFNAHAHSPMTLMRGYGENMVLMDWLQKKIFPFEDCLTGEDVYYATLLAMAESIRFGIISTSDMYYFCEEMARAVLESGAKANISRSISAFDDEELWTSYRFRESKKLYEEYHKAGDGKLLVDMSLHSEYTTKPKTVEQLAQYTKETGLRMHVHLSETKVEHEECKERHEGRTPIRYMYDLGVFDSKVTAAHCVHAEEEDMDILAEKGASVATCPVSNLKLSSGVCNAPLMLKKGINIAIGTDSVTSNNSLNFIEEIKFYALVQKGRWGDATAITPREALYAATTAGALAQDREDTGKLAAGMKADLIVLDISGVHMSPVHDLANNIVYSASGSDVVLTMSDGRVLYRDGSFPTIDIEKAKFEVERSKARILGELS